MSDRLEHPTCYIVRVFNGSIGVHFGPYRRKAAAEGDAQNLRARFARRARHRVSITVQPLYELHEPGIVSVGWGTLADDLGYVFDLADADDAQRIGAPPRGVL